MRRASIRTAAAAVMLTVALALPGVAGAASRVRPSPTVMRIAAVTVGVRGANAWLGAVLAALPPNPCTPEPGPPDSPVCLGLEGVLGGYEALATTVGDACDATRVDAGADDLLPAALAPATDARTALIVRQLAAITAVLGAANAFLGGILVPSPGPPEAPEAAALAALYDAVVAGAVSIPPVDPDGNLWPPNPCIPSPGPPELPA